MSRSVAWELVRRGYLVRSVRPAPFVPAVVAVAIMVVTRGTGDALGDLRLVGLLLALGAGYALDDSAAVTLQAGPWGLLRRQALRVACALAVIAPLWMIALARLVPSGGWDLAPGLSVELAAGLALVWAVAGWTGHGIASTPALLAALLLASASSRAPMLAGPGPQWTSAHWRWAAVLLGAGVAFLAALRDPAARVTVRSASRSAGRGRSRGR